LGSCLPNACARLVCVPIPRELNIQKTLERAIVPTPNAARDSDPRPETYAVSTSPVMGSAIKENYTGKDKEIRVKCGEYKNG
jgi:hypothetical protein